MYRALAALSLLSLPLAACASSDDLATTYMNAIQAGDANTAADLFCHQDGYSIAEVQLVSDWEIIGTMERDQGGVPVEVATVEATVPRAVGEDTETFEIWIVTADNAYQLAEQANQALAQAGVAPPVLDREAYRKKGRCITLVRTM